VTAVLSQQELDRYYRDGIVFPIRVVSELEVAAFRDRFQAIEHACGELSLKRFEGLHLFFDWAHRLATHDGLLDVIERILGSDILIAATLVLYKPPHDSSYVSWHQDSVYSGWHLTPSTSAWIALTPSHRANGCMRAVPGSHQQGLLEHSNVRDNSNMLLRGESVRILDESRAVDVVLQPGEMSLHHSTIVHGSNPNISAEPRIGFIVRFVTSRIASRPMPLLRVRGEGDCSHLNLANPPAETPSRSALSAWRAYSGHQACTGR
jgi:hypothetical protein